MESHDRKLRQVFEKLSQAGLTVKPTKCKFYQNKLVFLGHEISSDGIRPNDLKVRAVKTFPTPTTKKELKSFLGLANFFRKFMKDYSTIAAPLTDLLKEEKQWNWTSSHDAVFAKLKQLLISAPVLVFPDYTQPFRLYSDASATGVGATLCQYLGNKLHPIAYASKKLGVKD